MTDRIDHAAEARDWLDRMPTDDAAWASACAQASQAEATLALVEQQRIANLVALSNVKLTMPGGGEATFIYAFDVDWVEIDDVSTPSFTLRPDIAAALGIEATP